MDGCWDSSSTTTTTTLFLMGSLDKATKLERIQKALDDRRIENIHVVGQDFGNINNNNNNGNGNEQVLCPVEIEIDDDSTAPAPATNNNENNSNNNVNSNSNVTINTNGNEEEDEDDDDDDHDDDDGIVEEEEDDGHEILMALVALLQRRRGRRRQRQRQWKTIKLLSCRGRVDLLLESMFRGNEEEDGSGSGSGSSSSSSSSVCSRLIISPPPPAPSTASRNNNNNIINVLDNDTTTAANRADQQQRQEQQQEEPQNQNDLIFGALRRGLLSKSPQGPTSSSTSSLTALCLHDMTDISAQNMNDLAEGLNMYACTASSSSRSSSSSSSSLLSSNLIELSFQKSTFTPEGVEVLTSSISKWTSIQHLNFQNCKLSDVECASIIDALSSSSGHRCGNAGNREIDLKDNNNDNSPPHSVTRRVHNILLQQQQQQQSSEMDHDNAVIKTRPVGIMELCLDGNYCHQRGMDALGRFISTPHNNLLVVDIASQIFDVNAIRAARTTTTAAAATATTVAVAGTDGGGGGGGDSDSDNDAPPQVVSSLDLKQFSKALTSPHCHICGIQLSDNRISSQNIIALCDALKVNRTVKIVHLAWCRIKTASSKAIGEALKHNKSITKLVLYESKMDDTGMSNLVHGLDQNRTLKKLDVSGKQHFTMKGLKILEDVLRRHESIEYVSIRDPHKRNVATASTIEEAKNGGQCMLNIEFQCDLNRGGGQRFLRAATTASAISQSTSSPNELSVVAKEEERSLTATPSPTTQFATALWPIVLERTCKMDLPTIRDPFAGSSVEDTLLSSYRRRMSSSKNKSKDDRRRKASVLYHLIRNGNTLHESLAK